MTAVPARPASRTDRASRTVAAPEGMTGRIDAFERRPATDGHTTERGDPSHG